MPSIDFPRSSDPKLCVISKTPHPQLHPPWQGDTNAPRHPYIVSVSKLVKPAWLLRLRQVVGQDGDADKHAESLFAVSKTTFHSPAAEEHKNAAFDAGAEALRFFEIRTFLKGLPVGSFPSAAGECWRSRYQL
jgi:hypothetical protein